MSTALFTDLSSYFNNIDPEDPVYQRELLRPAEIKEDVKLMEQRKRVSNIMRSKLFKKDLENIFLKYQFDDDPGISTSNLSLADISEQLLLSAIPKNKVANFSQLTNRKGLISINDLNSSISSLYGKTERLSRCKLASIFRLINMYGWNSNFNSVMTNRPFSDKDQFLINPFGLLFHEITASSLISVDYKGNILDFGSTVLEANPLAWMIHSAIYSCQHSIRAILELKTPAALAISSLEHGLLPICREAILLGSTVILDNLPGFVSESKSISLIMTDLNNYLTSVIVPNSKILIVPNCGFLICGEHIEEAWHLLMNCQIACETQMKLGNLTIDDLYIPDKNCQADLFHQWRSTDLGGVTKIEIDSVSYENSEHVPQAQWRIGELEFEALMRHMDNNGYRTGYMYRQENIYQSEKPLKPVVDKVKYEVEIPPSSISTIDQIKSADNADENRANKSLNVNHNTYILPQNIAPGHFVEHMRVKTEKWFNTPNTYKLIEDNDGIVDNNLSFNFPSVQSDRKSARWASAKAPTLSSSIPQHPVTAGAYVAIGHHHPSKSDSNKDKNISKINPKELLENQKRVKNKYYYDTNTAGPISCLLDSNISREEARMIKNESLKKHLNPSSVSANDQVVTSASKGIIQRGHKALVYQDLFKSGNPFDVTADELAAYHNEVDRKLHPERYKSVEIPQKDKYKEENPEIKITISQNESSLPSPENEVGDTSSRRDTGLTSDSDLPKFPNQKESSSNCVIIPTNSVECHPFFQSDFDEDFNNLKLIDSACNSTPLNEKCDGGDGNIKESPVVPSNLSGDNTKLKDEEDALKSATMKESKRKSFRSFSFKRLGKSKSLHESADILENKSATLAAPGYGTITSETSGVDISNDELDKDNKSKKKKRKFKLPSFSKKKKDKSKQ